MDKNKIMVQVRFFGALAMYATAPEISVEVENGCDLNCLLSRLLEINPPAYRDLLNQGSRKESFLRVMLNDSLVNEKDFGLLLSQGDLVTLLPAISGGAG
jgi:molybdopterin converting factor small subunit